MYFGGGVAEYLRFDTSNFLLSDDLLPNANDTLDLGSNTYRWQDLYLGPGTLHIGTSTTDEGTFSYNTTTNLLDLSISGTSVATFGLAQAAFGVPTAFNAAGDASFGYDLVLTNQTASKIQSYGPLTIESGENFENQNLTLTTFGTGDVVFNLPSSGAAIFQGAVAIDSQQTLTANDTDPSVAAGSHWITNNNSGTNYTNFLDGTAGQILIIEVNDANTTFNCIGSEATINCGNLDIAAAAGDILTWVYDGTIWNLINWMDEGDTQTGADLAELYVSSQKLEPGDIVMVDNTNSALVKKTTTPYQNASLGIVSTNPGIILGQGDYEGLTTYPIALAGRVPLKTNTENGPVMSGDPLTPSSTPGVAMKAIRAGRIIGYALEDLNSGTDKVLTFVNSTWYDPQTVLTASGDLNLTGSAYLDGLLTVQGVNVLGELQTLTTNFNTNSTEGSEQLGQITTEIDSINSQLETLTTTVNQLAAESTQSTQSSGSGDASAILGQITQLYNDFVEFTNDLGLSASTDNQGENVLTIDSKLVALAEASFNDVVVTGDLNVGMLKLDSIANSIGIIGPACYNADTQTTNQTLCDAQTLYIQKELAGNIDLFDAGIVLSPDGGIKTVGKIEAKQVKAEELILEQESVGSGVLEAGETTVTIESTLVKVTSKIFITPTTSTQGASLYISSKDAGTAFEVNADSPASQDIEFDWFIVNEN